MHFVSDSIDPIVAQMSSFLQKSRELANSQIDNKQGEAGEESKQEGVRNNCASDFKWCACPALADQNEIFKEMNPHLHIQQVFF